MLPLIKKKKNEEEQYKCSQMLHVHYNNNTIKTKLLYYV